MPFDTPALELRTDLLVIRPQLLDDNAADYRAVMANREWLRRWSGSPWPADTFTLEDNREDLIGHIDDHRARTALGFSIATRVGIEILGSIYVQEIDDWLDEYAATDETRRAIAGAQARVDLWTRLDSQPDLLENVVTSAASWFAHEWNLKAIWRSRLDCPELERAYALAGMRHVARLTNPETGRVQLLYRL